MNKLYITIALVFCSISQIHGSTQNGVTVRLFSSHSIRSIVVIPHNASGKWCSACDPRPLATRTEISAAGQQVSWSNGNSASVLISGSARIEGEAFTPIEITGELSIRAHDGYLILVMTMPLERYVSGVVAGETSVFKSDEALKAMAVAARTYAVYFGSRHNAEGFDFCDSTHCQRLLMNFESPRVRAAVTATRGELLWYEGHPAAAYYSRNCGGEADNAASLDSALRAPYLQPHRDEFCPRDEWQADIAHADIESALGKRFSNLKVGERDSSGRVRTVRIDSHVISAADFRLAIGRALGWNQLRSDLYEMEQAGDRVLFRGHGQGHGVGLCQAGSDAMGQQGRSYREILAYYYPGTTVAAQPPPLKWQRFSGEIVDVMAINAADADAVIEIAQRALGKAQRATGWRIAARPLVQVFPTIESYRDLTGEPGWVAASTRDLKIRLQPVDKLRAAGSLTSTLEHEMLHIVIDSQANPATPMWLREGLALYLSNPNADEPRAVDTSELDSRLRSAKTEQALRAAYRDCEAAVASAVAKYRRAAVLDSVKSRGILPTD